MIDLLLIKSDILIKNIRNKSPIKLNLDYAAK